MNTTQLYKKLQKLVSSVAEDSFIYDFLLAYGIPKANITRLKNGSMNKGKAEGQIILAKKILFQPASSDSLFSTMEWLRNDPKAMQHGPRFFVVTDYKSLLAYDTKVDDTLDIELADLPKSLEFFNPLAGRERYSEAQENPADLKAAEKMARLYDEILKNNPDAEKDQEQRHSLNVFLSRLLFCFFAEDTDIFPNHIFSKSLTELTKEDGSDLDAFLNQLFEVLNTENRDGCIDQLCKFPYVNGGLFGDSYDAPKMTRRARRMILDCGALDWSEINPDIFGSMIQAVVDPEQRGGLGMHYTSVPNIMKVIEPLFLNDLREEFEKAYDDAKKLAKLLNRIRKIRFFDPACGSGNFLIITYKEIRTLEMEIVERRKDLDGYIPLHSLITLDHFYGIEIDDFAHEVAILSLWLAEHQMNVLFKKRIGAARPALPLREGGKIVCGNSARLRWEDVCPSIESEIFILGNPPYLGQRNQSSAHQSDMDYVFRGLKNYKNLDYISIWFYKAACYCSDTSTKFAFVSTNSLFQGTQVEMLWPHVIEKGIGIFFAHKNLKWTNNARNNAGVTVSIVGLTKNPQGSKYLFSRNTQREVDHINFYLTASRDVIVKKRRTSISILPKMEGGNQPREGGNLILSDSEKNTLLNDAPEAERFIKKLTGSNEFLNGIPRWCIWINEDEVDDANQIACIRERIDEVRSLRENGNTLERNFINFPYRFVQNNQPNEVQLLIPVVSSERRRYIPIGVFDEEYIVLNSANVIFDPEFYVFGVLSSRIHNLWVKAVAGRMRTDIRYTSGVCFNSFPFPEISKQKKEILEELSLNILDVRDEHIGKTMADLYDPDKMPDDLREAHHQLDLAVDSCYRKKPFESDSERLEHLFKMYEKMTS